ncbi:gamma-adaptin [Basidiobolus meristosporus CBS 931.73]|uniref:AP-1 complex subunit gamma n=1 Tax=Basidiobolus meristosporus CBS 931.73 TaxID=1314790 RepID=A0A1Y1ZBC4_9FUNG|nr:gamma-adaptin [Basidiobolus meristosporus CBS 931.73]|eukprot:ORY07486.1 gamma-adaptin [Basidiobolus meristosporus CBS 931.73]
MPYYRLKDFIRAIRKCKTAADERTVIQKESASLRTSFKEENTDSRYNNVAKLLYIHMLGYPAHWGQIECLKLVASSRFADKRLGYLGMMLLLDENQELLTLVTNSLKNDLNHSNMYIVGLALCTLGNIASGEMAQDLIDEVEKLMKSSNTYMKKKAALCAIRLVRKAPDLYENLVEPANSLLVDKSHSVMLTGVTLIIELCQQNPENVSVFVNSIPTLVKRLKALSSGGFSPDHDITGITDPFLQVKIIRLLRYLGENNDDASEAMNDVLAQVATNTDSAKNAGNSVLYETVTTIMGTESDHGLRVLAINILGRFIKNKDNNLRYVALDTLNKTVAIDIQNVQRHRMTVVECLKDPDISIRRRALELSFALINEANVRAMTRELLTFLEIADTEFKAGMTTKICAAADRFAPNKRWHIDTVLRVLKLAGNYCREETLSNFIRIVANATELQTYTAQKLFASLKQDISKEALVLVGVWIIGEFGDLLVKGGSFEEEELVREVTESDVVALMENILNSPYANQTIREYIMTALIKLTDRFKERSVQERIKNIINTFANSAETEVQQRANEYKNLYGYNEIRSAVLERMPAPEPKPDLHSPVLEKSKPRNTSKSSRNQENALLNLLGDEPSAASSQPSQSDQTVDLLADIFGSSNLSNPQSTSPTGINTMSNLQQTTSTKSTQGSDSLLDLLGDISSPAASSPPSSMPMGNSIPIQHKSPTNTAQPPAGGYIAYNKNGFKVVMIPNQDSQNPNVVNIKIRFLNEAVGARIENLSFQIAVPKSQKLQMQSISSTQIPVNESATQLIRIANPQKTPIRLRLKVSYTTPSGISVDEISEFSGFPASLFSN